MTRDLSRKVSQLNKKRNLKKTGYAVLSILMCVTVFVTTYALIVPAITIDAQELGFPALNVSADWNDGTNLPENVSLEFKAAKGYTYTLEYSADNGVTWTKAGAYEKKIEQDITEDSFSGADIDALICGKTINTRYRVHYGKLKNGSYEGNTEKKTYSIKPADILDGIKSGFSDWLAGDYPEYFCETDPKAAPKNMEGLFAAFDQFYHLPSASIAVSTPAAADDPVTVSAYVDIAGSYVYDWQMRVTDPETHVTSWVTIPGAPTGSTLSDTETLLLPFGGATVRCRILDENGVYRTTSNAVLYNPQKWAFDETIALINAGLGLSTTQGCGDTYNLSLDGTIFNKYLYFDAVAKNPDVPFDSAETYRWYLCKTYLEAYNETAGSDTEKNNAAIAAVRAVWNRYLYDIFDPGSQNLSNTGSGSYAYPSTGGYADHTLAWPKSADSSFHGGIDPQIDVLDYRYMVNGVDYTNFISGLEKYATADAAGDSNAERKYNVDITADATAKMRAPVAMIFQIQTAWQLFDLEHANAVIGDGNTEVGAVAYNTEMATLYDIKCALLDFIDYMETSFPGNNMVVGVVEVQHDGSSSMFNGTDDAGKPLYVSNNVDVLRDGVLGWDIFGNCEHVHYDNDTLIAAVTNLPSNLSEWEDVYGRPVVYDDIQKVCVVIGGPTENTNSTNGLGCVLPWSTFKASKINSVYSVRVNEGTPLSNNILNPNPIISWLDYSGNNGPQYKDGNSGTGFTDKYVATTREALFNTFVEIALKEMSVKSISITAADQDDDNVAFVDDPSVYDTVRPEFRVDLTKPVTAAIVNRYGVKRYETIIDFNAEDVTLRTYDSSGGYTSAPIDAQFTRQGDRVDVEMDFSQQMYGDVSVPNRLVIKENADKTTDVSYNFGRLYNTNRGTLDFGIVAREDYLGSNNVYTNVGTPTATYAPPDAVIAEAAQRTEIEKRFQFKDVYDVCCFDRPQVNVPLDFTTKNGGFEVIPVGSTKDFYELDCEDIPDNIEDLIDNYGQTNGRLYYKWVGPGEGESEECGYIDVKNGVPQGGRPNLTYEKLFNEAGSYAAALQLRFVPDPVDEKGTFHDYVTKTAVNEKIHDGVANVFVVDGETKLSLDIRKEWVGGEPPFDVIYFNILDKDGNVYRSNVPLTADDGWEKTVSDLDALVEGELQEYSVQELAVEGYTSDMSNTVSTEYTYVGQLDLDFKPQIANPASYSNISVVYSYHNNSHAVQTLPIETALTADGSNQFTIPNLPVDDNGDPYTGTVHRIDYLDDGGNVYASFIGPEYNPYSVSSEDCCCASFTVASTKDDIPDKKYIVIKYTVGDSDTEYTCAYYTTAKLNKDGSTVTFSDLKNLFPAEDAEKTVHVTSVKWGDNASTPDKTSITCGSAVLGTEKYAVTFTAPQDFANGKTVAVRIVDGNGTPYTQSMKLTSAVKAGEKVTVTYDNFLPAGTYTLDDITYTPDQNTYSLADKTFVSFTLPVTLDKEVTVKIADENEYVYSAKKQVKAGAGDNVTVEFGTNPPKGKTYHVTDITYEEGGTKYLKKKTEVSLTAPFDLANGTVLTFTLTNGVTTFNETYTLTKDVKAGNLIEAPLALTTDTTGYSVSQIYYKKGDNEGWLTEKTKVTFTTPVRIYGANKDNDNVFRFTFWDGNDPDTTTPEYTVKGDAEYAAGREITVVLNDNPPDGYVVKTMQYNKTPIIEKTVASFVTPIELKAKNETSVTISDGTHTYDETVKVNAAAGSRVDVYFDDDVAEGTYHIESVVYNKNNNITANISSPSIKPGGAMPETTVQYGGSMPNTELEPGGMYPTSVIYLGGNLPENQLKLEGISRITAHMTAPCAIPANTAVTVYYEADGSEGSFTYTTTEATPVDGTADFRSGALPDGDYRILAVTHSAPGSTTTEHQYYYDLQANVSPKSKLTNVQSTPHYTVVNTPSTPLPATGGSGDRVFAVVGAAMMLSASLLGIVLKARAFRKRT